MTFEIRPSIDSLDTHRFLIFLEPPKTRLADRNPSLVRADWDRVKESIMKRGVKAKFEQNKEPLLLLLLTANRPIVYHTNTDSFWGDGGDGTGQNKLGKILMEVRTELAAQTPL